MALTGLSLMVIMLLFLLVMLHLYFNLALVCGFYFLNISDFGFISIFSANYTTTAIFSLC